MSGGRPKDRSMLSGSHDSKQFGKPSGTSHPSHPSSTLSNTYHGEGFSQHYLASKSRPLAVDLTHSADSLTLQHEHSRRMALLPNRPHSMAPSNHPSDRHDVPMSRERTHAGAMQRVHPPPPEKRNAPLHPPSAESSMPLPKKPRYHDGRMATTSNAPMPWAQPLRIDTTLDSNKMKMEPPGGYHPETEAISPTLPTESHDSKSDIVHSINEMDREINLIENQIQQLQKKQSKLEAEAAKPKGDIADEESNNESSKPLTIAQIVYRENRKLAQQAHGVLYKYGAPTELPLFHQPFDTEVFHENTKRFETFKSVLQQYFKKKTQDRTRSEHYYAETYENLVTNWLKKVDTKTIKKNIKDLKTREYFEKVFPEIKKSREDKERITSRVGARGVGGGYARTEAEFEQIMDGINEQEEEDKKMRAYAIIPPMLSQVQRPLRFINRNGLISEPMSEYKARKLSTNWSTEEKETFKEKYLDRPKQFGQIADMLEKKTLNDCVLHYYMSKKSENFKQLLKKQVKRPPRRPQMRPGIRTSNEGQLATNTESTSGTKNTPTEEEDIVRVTRSTAEDSKLTCCACGVKIESYAVSHNFNRSMCAQFGLDEQNYVPDQRMCATCFKLRRRRNKTCPIPSCTTPRRRIRHLPVKWDQIAAKTRETIMTELSMKEEVHRCCSSCYDKIADLLGSSGNEGGTSTGEGNGYITKWSECDINALKEGIQQHGKHWQSISPMVESKSEEQCKMYFYRNKKKQGLDVIYTEYKKRKAEVLGQEVEHSDDSADEDDDDNLEDNDLSSENESAPAPSNSILTKFTSTTSSTTPTSQQSVKDSTESTSSHSIETKLSSSLNDAIPSQAPKIMNGEVPPDPFKTENMDTGKPLIKVEKADYDSSATASADEEMPQPKHSSLQPNRKLLETETNTINKQLLSFLKSEPELWNNPDGMIHDASTAYQRPSRPDVTTSQASSHPRPANTASTSVRELIELAIEDALNEESSPAVSQRQSVINQCPSRGESANYLSGNKPNHTKGMRMDMRQHNSPSPYSYSNVSSTGKRANTPTRPASRTKEDVLPRRPVTNAPYGDPRDFSVSRDAQPNSHAMSMHRGEVNQIRAPPPAHSHHLTSSQMDIRNSADRKSPAVAAKTYPDTPFSVYDGKVNASNSRMSPHVRQPIGHPPPLISSGLSPHHPNSQLLSHKKENSHAGGSILQGTSATHSQPSANRFEGGSISHGTPRSQPEAKLYPQSAAVRGEEIASRSPRSQPPVHSPASVPSSQQMQHYDRLLAEHQLMYMQYEAMRRAGMPNFTGVVPPPFNNPLHEQMQTKSVLQNDFLTAKQMSSNSVNLPLSATGYPAGIDKDKGGKASPRPPTSDQLISSMAAGLPANFMEQQTMLMLFNQQQRGMVMPRMFTPERQRPLASQNVPVSSAMGSNSKEDAPRGWPPHMPSIGQHGQTTHKPEVARQAKPSIMQGMIPKTVESLHKQNNAPSPYMKKDNKTRYEKEIEEVKLRSLSEHRARTDSERTLTDTESSLPTPYSSNNRIAADYSTMSRSSSTGSRTDLASLKADSSNYLNKTHQQQQLSGYKAMGSMMSEDQRRNFQKSSDSYRDRIHSRSPYARPDDMTHSVGLRDERKIILEQDRKLSDMMKAEADKRAEMYSKPTDLSRPSPNKSQAEDGFVSKKLAEVSKGIEKRHLPKDASSLFSSSFEKDVHQHRSSSTGSAPNDMSGLTTANIIDAIITKQINNESNAEKAALSASHQHTSVIVPPKKQRPIHQSRSDTDITNYSQHHTQQLQRGTEVSSTSNSSPVSVMSTLASNAASNALSARSSGHITLADKINEIITNDYNKVKEPVGNGESRADTDGSRGLPVTTSGSYLQQPYRVEDVEPISPPNSGQSRNKYMGSAGQPTSANLSTTKAPSGVKKHAGIRSLLGADNTSNDSTSNNTNNKVQTSEPAMTGMSLMDVLKNNIEEAIIRHDSDLHAESKKMQMQQNPPMSITGTTSLYQDKSDDRAEDSSSRDASSGSKKRSLEAMLAPNSKRMALSPRRAKSPEEVELYTSSSGERSQHQPSTYHSQGISHHAHNRPPPGAGNTYPYPTSNSYRPQYFSPTGTLYNANNTFTSPSTIYSSFPKIAQPSPVKIGSLPTSSYSQPSGGQSFTQHRSRSPAQSYNYSQPQNLSTSRSSSTDKAENELVIDESSNHSVKSMESPSQREDPSNYSASMNQSSLPSATQPSSSIGLSNKNRTSPIAASAHPLSGITNTTNMNRPSLASAPMSNRISPVAASPSNNRMSPIASGASNNRMSPGASNSAHSSNNRNSPLLPNRQSPLVSRQSPMDNTVRSPISTTSKSPASPRVPMHLNTNSDMSSRHSSLSENDIPGSMSQKTIDAARSLNSLTTSHGRPLLSERYDTLSDDES